MRAAFWLPTRTITHSQYTDGRKSFAWIINNQNLRLVSSYPSATMSGFLYYPIAHPPPTSSFSFNFRVPVVDAYLPPAFSDGEYLKNAFGRVNKERSCGTVLSSESESIEAKHFSSLLRKMRELQEGGLLWFLLVGCCCRSLTMPKIAILIFCANISLLNYEHNHKLTRNKENEGCKSMDGSEFIVFTCRCKKSW